jgi:hypothetical protein
MQLLHKTIHMGTGSTTFMSVEVTFPHANLKNSQELSYSTNWENPPLGPMLKHQQSTSFRAKRKSSLKQFAG